MRSLLNLLAPACFGALALCLGCSTTQQDLPTVYAAGSNNGPGYWLNGTWFPLAPPAGSTWDGGNLDLVVSGSDLYVAGGCLASNFEAPGYWLNGTWVSLPLPTGAVATSLGPASLVVSGSDVYCAGFEISTNTILPGYWLNGAWVGLPLPSGAVHGATAMSLAVSGSDVYVAGFYPASTGGNVNGYWLNGTWTDLPDAEEMPGPMAVSGSTVLIADLVSPGGYWLNGSWAALAPPSGFTYAGVACVAASGNAAYAGGSCVNLDGSGAILSAAPGYWSNGAWVGLTPRTGSTCGYVNSMVVTGEDVYAGGGCYTPSTPGSVAPTYPGYWLDGVWVALPLVDGSGSVSSMFVLP